MKYLFVTVIAVLMMACSKKEPIAEYPYNQGETDNKTVATVAGDRITRAEVDYELAFYSTNPITSSESAKEKILEKIIEDQVFYNKAIENGFDKSPQFLLNQRKLLAHEYKKYMQKQVAMATTVSEWDIEAYYNANKNLFTTPAMYRLAIYFRRYSENKTYAYSLTQIAQSAKALDANKGFGKYALTSDHLKTNRREGKLAWISSATKMAGIPHTVLEIGRNLDVSDVSEIIDTDKGQYLVRLIDRKDISISSLESESSAIRKKLLEQRKKKMLDDYLEQSKSAYDIVLYKENLQSKKSGSKSHSFGPPGSPVQ